MKTRIDDGGSEQLQMPDLNPELIYLVGSAALGFSLSPSNQVASFDDTLHRGVRYPISISRSLMSVFF